MDAERIVDLLGEDGGAVVAASYGALAALLAAAAHPGCVRALVLFEPSCFSAARAGSAVEERIAALAPVFAVANDATVIDAEFSRRFAAGMGFDGPPLTAEQVEASVPRLRATPPPWSVEVDPAVVGRVPTLVVTGGWSALYDEVALSLQRRGARHELLSGFQHRPHDHPRANDAIEHHLAAASVRR